jgi:6-phosphogluconolactonase
VNAEPKISIHPNPSLLAASVAARLITRLVDVQNERGSGTVVLTGGSIGTAALKAVKESPTCRTVDWSRVDFWWGDERFLPARHPDRNAVQAREALLDHLDVDPARVHEFGSSDDFADEDAAAADYAARLQKAATAEGDSSNDPRLPRFDVLLLGVGPDAHVASLFPDLRASAPRARQPSGYPTRPSRRRSGSR